MHVHLSRAALSERQIAILMALVEDDYLYDEISSVAGRDFASNGYCKKSKDACGPNRYQAVNLAPRHTVEVRIFAGTICKEAILARLEWLNDLVSYAGQIDAVPSYGAFLVWQGKWAAEQYEALQQLIKDKRKEEEDKKKREERKRVWEERQLRLALGLADAGGWILAGIASIAASAALWAVLNSTAFAPPSYEEAPATLQEAEDSRSYYE